MQASNPAGRAEIGKFRDLARQALGHHLGRAPTRLVFQSSGLTNFVFSAVHTSGRFVIRISPSPGRLDAFIKEQWAVTEAAAAGVPVVRILETGTAPIPFPYMISEHVAGISATAHPDRFKILRELGSHAARINSIRTKGYGETFDWSNNELSRNDSLGDFLKTEFDYEGRLELLKKHKMCDAELIRKLQSQMRQMLASTAKPRLNHGDLRLKNVLVDDNGGIKAILDWESAISNIAPQWELSIALHDLSVDEAQHFLEGYGISDSAFVKMSNSIRALNILNYTREIERAAAEKDNTALRRIRLRFAGALDLFSIKK